MKPLEDFCASFLTWLKRKLQRPKRKKRHFSCRAGVKDHLQSLHDIESSSPKTKLNQSELCTTYLSWWNLSVQIHSSHHDIESSSPKKPFRTMYYLLKLWQNKKGRIFFSAASCKRHHFAEYDKQIFDPSYFVRALELMKSFCTHFTCTYLNSKNLNQTKLYWILFSKNKLFCI